VKQRARISRQSETREREGGMDVSYPEFRDPSQSLTAPSTAFSSNPSFSSQAAPSERAGGQALEPETRAHMERKFDFNFANVRVHTDGQAQASAQGMAAHAYTTGSDIVFNQGQYDPRSSGGQRLIAHELAHVVQQNTGASSGAQAKLEVSQPGDSSELEADRAADAVMNDSDASPALSGVARGTVQRFAQGDGTREHGGHAYMTEQALQGMGLNAGQARQGRFGNWERDLSQALTPGIRAILMEGPAWHGLNIIAIKEFGRGINLTEFGTYDPVEHMDNPTGLRASDVFQQGGFGADRNAVNQNPDTYGNATVAGGDHQGYATVGPRYAQTDARAGFGTVQINDPVAAFQVDESGIPRYMQTSKEWLKRTLRGAATLGREGDGGRGPREFSSGIHTMQDYYAHSNFCEIAINTLIRSGRLQVMNDAGQMQAVARDQSLDTFVHGNDAQGNPMPGNLTLPGGDRREVMTTGSFNLTDTAASILGEAKDKLVEANPFRQKKKGPSDLTKAALDYIDMTDPTHFNRTGQALSRLVRPVTATIAGMGSVEASLVSGAGHVAGSIASAPTQVGGGILRGMSTINGWLGGDSDYFDGAARRVEGAGNAVSGAITGTTDAAADKIRQVTGALDEYAVKLQSREHILSEVYAWGSGIDMLAPIKAMARGIPVIGERVAQAIETLQREIHEAIERELGDAFDAAVRKSVAGIDRAIEALKARTNVEQQKTAGAGDGIMDWLARKLGGVGDLYQNGQPTAGIAPQAYTPPSHTQIAKDHSDRHDRHGADGHDDGHDDHDEEGHGHNHISSWLNPVAEQLAARATEAIGAKVARAWDVVDRGGNPTGLLDDIDREVDEWFKHPNDCPGLWTQLLTQQLGTARVGPQLLAQLASRRPSEPRLPN
jgi:hypothetical protein